MAFDSPKAKGRDSLSDLNNPKGDLSSDAKLSKTASRQEQGTGRGSKRVTPSTADVSGTGYMQGNRVVGKLVKVGPNPKGTDTVKDPMNSYASKTLPAVKDPDAVSNRAGNNKAAGRNTGRTRL